MFNMFSGGAVSRMAVFALNVMPYISASIIVQLLQTVYPPWEKLQEGRRRGGPQAAQPIHPLPDRRPGRCSSRSASPWASPTAQGIVDNPGIFFIVSTMVTLTGGTMFLMWLGEQITSRGVGNGISLIIFAGIVARLPTGIWDLLQDARQDSSKSFLLFAYVGLAIGVVLLHRVHGARPAPPADRLSQAPGRQPHDRRRELLPAAEDQRLRGHSADLRLVPAAAAGDGHGLPRHRQPARLGAVAARRGGPAARTASPRSWCSTAC